MFELLFNEIVHSIQKVQTVMDVIRRTKVVSHKKKCSFFSQGKFEGHINLDDRNNYDLFVSRRKMGWGKTDSLYEAWLLSNFNECRGSFNRELFTR